MVAPDGACALSYNGELYGTDELTPELRSAGVRFTGGGDTEILFHALRLWGVDRTLSRIRGEYAFIWADGNTKTLHWARDPIGVHPLYYSVDGDRLALASEQKALVLLPWVDRTPRVLGMFRFLMLARTDDVPFETLVTGIRSLPAGFVASWDGSRLVERRYQRVDVAPAQSGLSDVRSALERSVAERLVSERALGVMVSGGLDSSAVALLADRALGSSTAPLHVFAYHDSLAEQDERPFQNHVIEAMKPGSVVHHVTSTPERFAADLDLYVDHQEEPYGDVSSYAEFCIARLAAAHDVRVLLNGLGGDEVFLGYPSFFGPLLDELLGAGELRASLELARAAPGITRANHAAARLAVAGAYHALPAKMRNAFTAFRNARQANLPFEWMPAVVGDAVANWHVHDGTPRTNAALRGSIESWTIPRYLLHSDRMTMAFGVETRVPLLDENVIRIAFGIPARQRVSQHGLKAALRTALSDVYPAPVRDRAWKLGFHMPVAAYSAAIDAHLRAGHARTCQVVGMNLPWTGLSAPGRWRSGMLGIYIQWLESQPRLGALAV